MTCEEAATYTGKSVVCSDRFRVLSVYNYIISLEHFKSFPFLLQRRIHICVRLDATRNGSVVDTNVANYVV